MLMLQDAHTLSHTHTLILVAVLNYFPIFHWLQHAFFPLFIGHLLLYIGMVLDLKLCSNKSAVNASSFVMQCCLDPRWEVISHRTSSIICSSLSFSLLLSFCTLQRCWPQLCLENSSAATKKQNLFSERFPSVSFLNH